MKRILIIAAAILALTVSCTKKTVGIQSYNCYNITASSAQTEIQYYYGDATKVEYGYTLSTNPTSAVNPSEMVRKDVYDSDHAVIEHKSLSPATTYYSTGFLIVDGHVYSSALISFKTLNQ